MFRQRVPTTRLLARCITVSVAVGMSFHAAYCQDGVRTSDGFKTAGLTNEKLFRYIHDSSFEAITTSPKDALFVRMLAVYIEKFANSCPKQLLRDPVQLTRSV